MHALHFTHQSLVPVRAEAADASEMVNQLLFGDLVELLDTDRQWRRVRSRDDGYEGWIDEKMVQALPSNWLPSVVDWKLVTTPYVPALSIVDGKGTPLHLVQGSKIPVLRKQEHPSSYSFEFPEGHLTIRIPRGNLAPIGQPDAGSLLDTSADYLCAPYLWGGRSPWGIDCSGFTQVVYRCHGIQLPRDASQQVQEGLEVSFEEKRPGDLAFFENEKGKVIHVGFVLPDGEIRHAHGNVHDDRLDESGIWNVKGIRTHRLCSIKRYIT